MNIFDIIKKKLGDLASPKVQAVSNAVSKKPVEEQPGGILQLPKLYTEGTKIKREDTKKEVVLKGLTSEAFRNGADINDALKHIDTTKKWGANMINFYIDPEMASDTKAMAKLDSAIAYASKNNLYVSLQPVVGYKKNWDYGDTPIGIKKGQAFLKTVEQTMPDIAKRYKNKNNVLYGTWTEPHPTSIQKQEVFMPFAEKVTKKIQKENPDAVVFIDVSNTDDKRGPVDAKNVIYHNSQYYGENIKKAGVPEVKPENLWYMGKKGITSKAPMMFNEFGAYWGGDMNSPEDVETTKKMLDITQKNNTPYIAFTLDSQHPLALSDRTGQPTNKGKVFKENLEAFPATKFDKQFKPETLIQPATYKPRITEGYKPLTFRAIEAVTRKFGRANAG